MKIPSDELMLSIVNEIDLASITFVRDYMQFNFDGPCLNIYVWPVMRKNGTIIISDDLGYRDNLCTLIGRKIISIKEVPGDALTLTFDNQSSVQITLNPDKLSGAEAAMFQDGTGKNWAVW